MKKYKVIMCEPEKLARITEIEASLESYQSIVEGYIECLYPFKDKACIVANDEGKINGMPLNRALKSEGKLYDIVAGTFFIIGIEGDDFCSLTNEQSRKYLNLFRYPELFFRAGKEIKAIPFKP